MFIDESEQEVHTIPYYELWKMMLYFVSRTWFCVAPCDYCSTIPHMEVFFSS